MNKEISGYKLMTFFFFSLSSKRSNRPIHRKPEKKKKNILVKMQKEKNSVRRGSFFLEFLMKITDESTRIRS